MQHLITVCGYIFITMFVLVTSTIIIAVINHNRKVKKAKKRMEAMWEAKKAAQEAELEQAGEALLTYVKSHLEFLDNQWISKN